MVVSTSLKGTNVKLAMAYYKTIKLNLVNLQVNAAKLCISQDHLTMSYFCCL